MPRTSPPVPKKLRAPDAPAPPPPARPAPPGTAELQLSITKTGIGLELASPSPLGGLTVRELSASLPGLRFPLDVSGGVTRFRHRRGRLERLVLEVSRPLLELWAALRLRGLLGVQTPSLTLLVRRAGATVGVLDASEGRCLAFELEVDATDESLAVSVHNARGAGLPGPATALAIRAVHAAAGHFAVRAGGRFVFSRAATSIVRALFPDVGARTPDTTGLAWTTLRGQQDAWLLVASRDEPSAEPSAMAVLAREACELARDSDDAAFVLDFEKARTLAVAALERAPRHRELLRRLAEIDHAVGGRAEAALATMRDVRDGGSAGDGLLLARLLVETGDTAGAVAAFARMGESEPIGALAATAFEQAAAVTRDPYDALGWLDRAVARAPSLHGPRWARMSLRLSVGRVEDARADAEHLEALANGARAKHAVWARAGRTFRDAGWRAESMVLFERALRYDPRDAEAMAGLGAALVAGGKTARGAELLTRALKMAEANGKSSLDATAQVDLARVLGEALGDKPAAIARVRDVPAQASCALVARGLEARWRAELGDLAGASLAFARARDLAEARAAGATEGRHRDAVAVLVEAAKFESEVRGDWLAAQRHLGAAVRIAPDDGAALAAYREVGRRVAGLSKTSRAVAPEENVVTSNDPPLPPKQPVWDPESTDALVDAGALDAFTEANEHARIEELTRKVHADPSNDQVIDELAERLLRLGRTHELFALLSARLDEAAPERRESLLPKQREVLRRLEKDASAAGRADEAALYREALSFL